MKTKENTTLDNNKIGQLPLEIPNFDKHDLDECASILRHVEALESKGANLKELQVWTTRIDNQVNYAMLF